MQQPYLYKKQCGCVGQLGIRVQNEWSADTLDARGVNLKDFCNQIQLDMFSVIM